MDWSAPVSLYCERADLSFWGEPVNALTNAAFLIAAAAGFVLWRRAGGRDLPVLTLIVVVAAVGLGSFTFHTVATRGAALADVVPIAIFIYGYLALALHRFLHLSALTVVAVVIGFAAGAQALAVAFPARLNGSVAYLPALLAMIGVALAARGAARSSLALAAIVFAASLALRTIDRAVCAEFPLGTHFLWHLLNAVVLYVLLRAAITATEKERESAVMAVRF
jgi:hypothetical protein